MAGSLFMGAAVANVRLPRVSILFERPSPPETRIDSDARRLFQAKDELLRRVGPEDVLGVTLAKGLLRCSTPAIDAMQATEELVGIFFSTTVVSLARDSPIGMLPQELSRWQDQCRLKPKWSTLAIQKRALSPRRHLFMLYANPRQSIHVLSGNVSSAFNAPLVLRTPYYGTSLTGSSVTARRSNQISDSTVSTMKNRAKQVL